MSEKKSVREIPRTAVQVAVRTPSIERLELLAAALRKRIADRGPGGALATEVVDDGRAISITFTSEKDKENWKARIPIALLENVDDVADSIWSEIDAHVRQRFSTFR